MGGPFGDGRGPLTRAEARMAAEALSEPQSAWVLRHVAVLAPEAVGAAISELRTHEAVTAEAAPAAIEAGTGGPVIISPAWRLGDIAVTVAIPEWMRGRLAVLDPEQNVATVLARLADHAQQAVYRPGSWERDWAISVFGDDWIARTEPDPESTCGHVRPK